ncbi:MAG: hypothetical protein AAFX81_18900 [Pseudomonadota bacterium]
MQRPIVLDGLVACWEHGHDVCADCLSCGRRVRLDIPAIVRRHGRDVDLKRRLRCSDCGARSPAVYMPSPGPAGEMERRRIARAGALDMDE